LHPDGRELRGTIVGVEYGAGGPILLIDTYQNGGVRRVPLRNGDLAGHFDDERKRVRVRLDAEAYADAVTVEL
jgi:hypothetical protein